MYFVLLSGRGTKFFLTSVDINIKSNLMLRSASKTDSSRRLQANAGTEVHEMIGMEWP